MLGATPRELPQRFAFVVIPDFTMIGFTAAVDTLRLANLFSGRELYRWHLVSPDGQPVVASSGIPVLVEGGLEQASDVSAVVVCGGINTHRFHDKSMFAWLRRMARRGADIGALCTGCHVLAEAGLLDGYRCTIHWENLPAFTERFPDVEVTSRLFEIDRNRFTCAGGTATIDMMLGLIAIQHGHELAGEIAESIIHERIREHDEHQRTSLPARLGVRHPKLLAIIDLMEKNLEEPLERHELAAIAGLSTRQLERLFRKYLDRSPARYYLELRLHKARLLLLQTNLSVMNVALACGFVSPSHFTKCYRAFFGHTPYRERGVPNAKLKALAGE